MKYKLNDIWSEQETASKKIWKLQVPKDIVTFSTKKQAQMFFQAITKEI